MNKPGFYFDTKTYKLTAVSKGDKFDYTNNRRIPTIFMLVLAPMLGATLVLTLPFLGFYLLGEAIVRKIGRQDWIRTSESASRLSR